MGRQESEAQAAECRGLAYLQLVIFATELIADDLQRQIMGRVHYLVTPDICLVSEVFTCCEIGRWP